MPPASCLHTVWLEVCCMLPDFDTFEITMFLTYFSPCSALSPWESGGGSGGRLLQVWCSMGAGVVWMLETIVLLCTIE